MDKIVNAINISSYSAWGGNMTSTNIVPNNFSVGSVSLEDMIEAKIKELEKSVRFTFTELSCRNCGGKITQRIDDYIVKCPYCGTAYLIGREQIYSR